MSRRRMVETKRYDSFVEQLSVFIPLSSLCSQEPDIECTYSKVTVASIVALLAGELFNMLTGAARVHLENWRTPHVEKQVQSVSKSQRIDTCPSCHGWLIHSRSDVNLPGAVVGVISVFANPFERIDSGAGLCDGVSPSVMEVCVSDVAGAVGQESSRTEGVVMMEV